VLLQESARPDIRFRLDLPEHGVIALLDPTLLNQAVTNLLKNAVEAIEARRDVEPEAAGEIRVRLTADAETLAIDIQDNGSGLPEHAARLFEPYVTHRSKGTGLGLSIVKKIIEDHDGTLDLMPAPAFDDAEHAGAWARIVLPQVTIEHGWDGDETTAITKKLRESM
jgi:two-component system nitrogen regulation sensor histidine kinase NtrY